MNAVILPFHTGPAPRIERSAPGYATVPRQIIRCEDLTYGAKVLLSAIIGICYGDARQIKSTIQEIGVQAGMSAKTVRYFLPELIAAKLILRRRDPERIGGPWLTCITCDPKGFQLSDKPENWRVKTVVNKHTPPTHSEGRPLPTARVDPYPSAGGGLLIQKTLTLNDDVPAAPASEIAGSAGSSSCLSDSPPNTDPEPHLEPSQKDVPVRESSPPEPQDPSPIQISLAVTTARRLWPSEPRLEQRVRELAAANSPHKLLLAVEYSEHMKGGGIGYVVNALNRWYRDGLGLDDIQAEVRAAERAKSGKKEAVPTMQNFNPAAPIEPERPPTTEEVAETMDVVRRVGSPTVRRLNLAYLKRWVMMGWIAPEILEEFAEKTQAAKKHRLRVSLQSPPQPAGVHLPQSGPSVSKHTVKGCSRQESRENGPDGLLPLDSTSEKEDSMRLSPKCPP